MPLAGGTFGPGEAGMSVCAARANQTEGNEGDQGAQVHDAGPGKLTRRARTPTPRAYEGTQSQNRPRIATTHSITPAPTAASSPVLIPSTASPSEEFSRSSR